MPYLLSALLGYGLGCINPAYILAKLRGFDIREKGSRNAGASNVVITLGKAKGIFCAAFDIGKAALAVLLARLLFNPVDTFAVTAAACILGHIFPFYMRFRGGKGLACLAGVFLAFDLRVFAIMLAAEIVLALITKYICIIPLTASITLPFIYGFMMQDLWGGLLLGGVAIVIWYKHAVNVRRILQGTELRLTYLWNRDKEASRLKKFYPDEEDT